MQVVNSLVLPLHALAPLERQQISLSARSALSASGQPSLGNHFRQLMDVHWRFR